MTLKEVLSHLESLASPANVAGMERYGIVTTKSFGISAPVLRDVAREVKKAAADRHALALQLWDTGIYDARAVAFFIDDPKLVSGEQMESWAGGFDNWATVDGACGHLFCRTAFGYEKAFEWAERDPEFVKRAGFSLMAYLAVHDKKAADEKIARFLPVIEKHSGDERNFVKKAVNWALRQIGKRSPQLNKLAIDAARRIRSQDTSTARWIAADALRELTSEKVAERLSAKRRKRA
jgi:3-methyladenine DNA glycosylase AlkD